ncbi:hypothetical protein J4727_16745 [Providencia rettgeri]|uniref:Uncharacterized protein n=1 Tax=Providencia rettgeri TaxID=587 RepID=A0A939NG32_PRORE|nr:hypothetical protein [Providencia rettgeri]
MVVRVVVVVGIAP